MRRREFISCAGAAFCTLGSGTLAAKAAGIAEGKKRLRIGIMSDVHITTPESSERFIKALKFLRSKDIDGVLIAGDLIDGGVREQFEVFAQSWFSVFPNNRGRNGEIVEKLFVYGNHDIGGHIYSYPP